MNPPMKTSLARRAVDRLIYREDFGQWDWEDVREAAFIDKLFINLE